MSDASLPQNEGERFSVLVQQGNPIIYSGSMEGESIRFWFNLDNMTFTCEALVQGQRACMSGTLANQGENKVSATPVWGVQPGTSEWVSTIGEEVKTFDLGTSIEFEGVSLKRED